MTRKVIKMISKLKQEGVQAKPMEAKRNKASSRQGPCLRGNPRIFRVSPLFGGKDRHSKVCTIKGLRDRRIRLSAPTAIQLYDLQNRLGLSQPSKVIDWLIDVTKLDIDKLPPLQIPKHFDPNASVHQSAMLPQVFHFHADVAVEAKDEESERLLAEKLSPLPNHASLPALQNNAMDENYYHFEPSSVSLSSQFGSHGSSFDPYPLMEANPASFSSPSASAQSLFCPLTISSEVSPYPSYNSQVKRNSSHHQSHQTQF